MPIYTWDIICGAVKELENRNNIKLTNSAWDLFKDAERKIKERMESQDTIDRALWNDVRNDRDTLASVLAEMEHVVNKSVGGTKIGIMEWLALIQKAQKALGERSISK